MAFTEAELKKAVTHLAFDVYHFRCYARLHREGQLQGCAPTVSQAVIYALLLHLRLLLDFFYGPPMKDDFWVGHFNVLPGFASNFPPITDPKPDEARALSNNLNKWLAHLTATRWEKPQPTMAFYDQYFDGIEKILTSFEAALPDDARQAFTKAHTRWEKSHPANLVPSAISPGT
jgi:hypothetical protein